MSGGLGSLFEAVKNNDIDVVKKLIEKGADINMQNKHNKNTTSSLSAVFNHAASGAPGPAPQFVPPDPSTLPKQPRFDPDKVEMKTKRKVTAPKTAKWRKKGRGAQPDAKSKQGKDRRGGGKPPGA